MDDPTLREYLEQQILSEQALRIQAQESHAAIHAREADARDKADAHLQEYKESANQFRAQLYEERVSFVGKDYYDTQHAALRDEFRLGWDRIGKAEQVLANYDGRMFMFGLGLTMLNLVFLVASRIFGK